MTLRRYVCVGDPPVTGGAALPYSVQYPNKVDGHQVAMIGGKVYCEKCKSTGIIAKAGGPRRGKYNGGEIALAGDLCLCKCSTPPPMLATLGIHGVDFEDTAYGDAVPVHSFDEQIRCLSEEGHVMANMSYVLTLSNGRTVEGVTDEHGRTERICDNEPIKVKDIDFSFPVYTRFG